MTIKNWKKYLELGYIMTSYTFVRCLGGENALTLCQILSEYNYANNKGVNLCQAFLSNLRRMANYVGISEYKLMESLNTLVELELIAYQPAYIDESTYIIWVYEDNILKFKQEVEEENMYSDWDTGLTKTQNPINSLTQFSESTLELQKYIDNILKDENALPIIVYSICEFYIRDYENSGKDFCSIPMLAEKIKDVLLDDNFTYDKLIYLINNIIQIESDN